MATAATQLKTNLQPGQDLRYALLPPAPSIKYRKGVAYTSYTFLTISFFTRDKGIHLTLIPPISYDLI